MEEFLAAVGAMRVDGDIEPMFTFVTETLCELWEIDRWLVTGDEYLQQRLGLAQRPPPSAGDPLWESGSILSWPSEPDRQATVRVERP